MIISIKGRITDIRDGNKGNTYLTLLDTEQGGMCKITLPGGASGVKIDSLLDIKALVKPGISQYGLFLQVEELLKDNTTQKGEDK